MASMRKRGNFEDSSVNQTQLRMSDFDALDKKIVADVVFYIMGQVDNT